MVGKRSHKCRFFPQATSAWPVRPNCRNKIDWKTRRFQFFTTFSQLAHKVFPISRTGLFCAINRFSWCLLFLASVDMPVIFPQSFFWLCRDFEEMDNWKYGLLTIDSRQPRSTLVPFYTYCRLEIYYVASKTFL